MKARRFTILDLLTFCITLFCISQQTPSLALAPVRKFKDNFKNGYEQRVTADPRFAEKSAVEIIVAAGTQFTAELNRRGKTHLIPELDFVVAGILTAIAGKYYSMWRVAPTASSSQQSSKEINPPAERRLGAMPVPTNAFQEFLMDGNTRPTFPQRLGSLIAPMPSLMQAGIIASTIGYGSTAVLISLRSLLVPSFVGATQNVNILYASIYTGVYMAVSSNFRYQLLSGVLEPKIIDRLKGHPILHAILLFAIRTANGLIGSILAIAGMRWLGLQKLK
mmetsp:Transcript_14772/g.23102  ORF Transcript_14772/g.23102 Transcript_14772/m.23102 type:complete len:278 (-) Transcript_14772:2428-3261(-)